MKNLIVVKSGGDIATGIAHRLFRSGFHIAITEINQPTVIRRSVSFAEAVYTGQVMVENVIAVRAGVSDVDGCLNKGMIPVLIDPQASCVADLKPWAVVDAILAKKNTGTAIDDAPYVIGVGPGFFAGKDVHAVIETMRGHDLGRVITAGAAQTNTGIPGSIGGYTLERVLRAPAAGKFHSFCSIGDKVAQGDIIAQVNGTPVCASISGVLRGILHNGLQVQKGMKIGDIDPRCRAEHCMTISDKARAVGGGVLEALLWLGAII